jgi:hypothetical protein
MEAFSCIDETFDVNLASEYRLSIQVGLDGFSFSVLDDLRKKFLVFKHFPLHLSNYSFLSRKLNEILEEESILQISYKAICIGVNSPVFTFAPFDEMAAGESHILGLNHRLNNEDRIFSYVTSISGMKIIYSIPESLTVVFRSYFSDPAYFHYSKPLILEYSAKIEQGKPSALIFRSNGHFTLLVHNGHKVVFANTFNFKAEEDFNFYVAASLQNQEVKPDEINLYLAGDIRRELVGFLYLKNKFRSVEFMKLPKDYQYSYTFGNFPQHCFLGVFNLEG